MSAGSSSSGWLRRASRSAPGGADHPTSVGCPDGIEWIEGDLDAPETHAALVEGRGHAGPFGARPCARKIPARRGAGPRPLPPHQCRREPGSAGGGARGRRCGAASCCRAAPSSARGRMPAGSPTMRRSGPTPSTARPRRRSRRSCRTGALPTAGRSPRSARPASTASPFPPRRASGSTLSPARCGVRRWSRASAPRCTGSDVA